MVMLRLMPSEPKQTRVISRTFVRRSLWTLAVLYVVYLVGGNILLNSASALRMLNRRPEAFQVQWARAETWWPGYLRASHLRLRGQAREWLWQADGEQASGRVLLWPLLHHEIRFASVDATEVNVTVQLAKDDLKPLPWKADAWWITADRIQTTSLRRLQWSDLQLTGPTTAMLGFTHQLRGGIGQHREQDQGKIGVHRGACRLRMASSPSECSRKYFKCLRGRRRLASSVKALLTGSRKIAGDRPANNGPA